MVVRSKNVLTDNGFVNVDIVIEDKYIVEIKKYNSAKGDVVDLGDRRIIPGFVDLHSDAIEKELEPRPGAHFPIQMAIVELDKKLAMAGITTIFHAIGFNDEELSKRGTEKSKELIENINSSKDNLLVDNFIHTRFEITSETSLSVIKNFIKENKINLLSIMDHSPGQGQFKTLEAWKKYHLYAYDIKEEEIGEYLKRKSSKETIGVIEELVKFALSHNITVLSHDDDCNEKLNTLKALGVTISEFPLSVKVAKKAKEYGMGTGMGAPNVVRGGSQSGNIAAKELIEKGVCDYLCSDYHPSSMLLSPYRLKEDINMPLEEGFKLITSNPAKLVGLNDRGEIKEGKLADIVVIDESYYPQIVLTFKNGRIVYKGKV
jgi:alpha-D-ribose 1-methylphosphonate 5-triphosphate diphosphatase